MSENDITVETPQEALRTPKEAVSDKATPEPDGKNEKIVGVLKAENGKNDEDLSIKSVYSKLLSEGDLSVDIASIRSGLENALLRQITSEIGIINLGFPENYDPEFEGRTVFPKSYYTLSPKERLLLLFAENFRRQFNAHYQQRKPLILAVENECLVQKFVSTTIRPTAFLFPELIQNADACADLVADYITYEPLAKPTSMPNRLISPESLLKRRKGNCLEMATLLASLLIGSGFPAYIVSGYASREVTLNDQRRVECPIDVEATLNMPDDTSEDKVDDGPANKYVLRDPPSFESKFLKDQEQKRLDKIKSDAEKLAHAELLRMEQLEKLPPDPFHGQRVHVWVAIIKMPPKVERTDSPEDGEDKCIEPCVRFIEPSTGFFFNVTNPNYFGVESVWNHENYYLNKQETVYDLNVIRWSIWNTTDWEHLLTAEPYECRVDRPLPEDVDGLTEAEMLAKEKHLDMPTSWVGQLHIGLPDFEERFPNGEKVTHYKKAIYERFAPYREKDGIMRRLTFYGKMNYKEPYKRWEWYSNRNDLLEVVVIDVKTSEIKEYFVKGRPDTLKYYAHNTDEKLEKVLEFYYLPRFDSLKTLHINLECIKEFYDKREDLLYYREFCIQPTEINAYDVKFLTKIVEKYYRDPTKLAIHDIAERTFNIKENKIFLKYHYAPDCITAATREFVRPPKPDYGMEIQYDPTLTSGYVSNPLDPVASDLELYVLLLKQLEMEDKAVQAFTGRVQEIHKLLQLRRSQMKSPKLLYNVFDQLRNEAPRRIHLAKFEEEQAYKEMMKKRPADFLAPYVLSFPKTGPPTREESLVAFNNCLDDIKLYYLSMLDELQRRYDEAANESKSLKKFLEKFQDQFNDYDFEKMMTDGESIDRYKRVLQRRIIDLHDTAQSKYESVKQSLKEDPRLNFS